MNQDDTPTVHVLFLVNNYPPSVGGVEIHVLHLAKEIVASGGRATVIALSDMPGEAIEDGIRVIRLRKHLPVAGVIAFPALGTSRRVARLMGDDKVTAVSTHTRFFPMSSIGIRVGHKISAPVIHTEHGSDFVRSSSAVITAASRLVDLTLGRRVLRKADAVLGVSEHVVAFVRKLASVEARVFYNAIDLAQWSVAQNDTSRHEPSRFCFLGRLVDGKGWEDFIEAAAILRRSGARAVQHFQIDLIGDGPDRAALERKIDELGLRSISRVHGQLTPSEVKKHLTGAILVNPTVLSEGFQTTLLESIATGGQIVSYPVPGLDQLIADGAPAKKVPAKDVDALAAAMESLLVRPKPALNASVLTKWSWERRGAQYLEIISALTAAR